MPEDAASDGEPLDDKSDDDDLESKLQSDYRAAEEQNEVSSDSLIL